MTKVLQIETLEAEHLLSRLEKIESAINRIAQVSNPKNAESSTESPQYCTRREVSKLLKITLVTVNTWTRKGILQGYKIGNRVYYKPTEVRAAMIKKGGAA